VFGSVTEINQLFRMPQREAGTAADVARIGRARCIAALQRLRHCGIRDIAVPRTVANSLVLAVPTRRRHPHFDFDVGVGRGFQRGFDPAKGWQALDRFFQLGGSSPGTPSAR
jgi:hypothetical protein